MTTETLERKNRMPTATPRRIDLSSLRDIRLELAHVYRQMDAGDIPAQDGTRRAFVLKAIADVLVMAVHGRQFKRGGYFPVKPRLLPPMTPSALTFR